MFIKAMLQELESRHQAQELPTSLYGNSPELMYEVHLNDNIAPNNSVKLFVTNHVDRIDPPGSSLMTRDGGK